MVKQLFQKWMFLMYPFAENNKTNTFQLSVLTFICL